MVLGSKDVDVLTALARNVGGRLLMDYDTPLVTPFLTKMAQLLAPYVNAEDLSKVNPREYQYSALLGQPPQVGQSDSVYLSCQDEEAVLALEYALAVVEKASDLMEVRFTQAVVEKPSDQVIPKEVREYCTVRGIGLGMLPFVGLERNMGKVASITLDSRIPDDVKPIIDAMCTTKPPADRNAIRADLWLPQTIEELVWLQRNAGPQTLFVVPLIWYDLLKLDKFRAVMHNPWYCLVGLMYNETSFSMFHERVNMPTRLEYLEVCTEEAKRFGERMDDAIVESFKQKASKPLAQKKSASKGMEARSKETTNTQKGGPDRSNTKI